MRRGIVKKRKEGKRERNREMNKQRNKEANKKRKREKKRKRKQRFFLYILKDDTKSNKFVIKSEVRTYHE